MGERRTITINSGVQERLKQHCVKNGMSLETGIVKLLDMAENGTIPSGNLSQFEDVLSSKLAHLEGTVKGVLEHFEGVMQHDVVGTFDHLQGCKGCIEKVNAAGYQVAYKESRDTRVQNASS